MSKPLHVQDTKDLLATLEEDLPEHNLEEDSVVSFLNRFKIVPGDHQVVIKRLYALYKKTSASVVPYNKWGDNTLVTVVENVATKMYNTVESFDQSQYPLVGRITYKT